MAIDKPIGCCCRLTPSIVTACPRPLCCAQQASRPCPMDIAFCEGLFFLTSHACEEAGEPSHGRLTVWDRQGGLLASHALGPAWRHPNGLAVFCQ